jgi:uncharacterized protein
MAIEIQAIPSLKIHATDDPNVAIAERSVSGRVIGNGNPCELGRATVGSFRNRLMVSYRERWNPQAFMAASAGTRF